MDFLYGVRIFADVSFVLSQSTRLTDGQTDGQSDGQNSVSTMSDCYLLDTVQPHSPNGAQTKSVYCGDYCTGPTA